ncbi:bile acid:sodium symporter family protein, partial [Bacillus smithii]
QKEKPRRCLPSLGPVFENLFVIVVLINSSVIAPYLRHVDIKLVEIGAAVFLIAFCGYYLSFIIGRMFKLKKDTVVAMTFLGGMRNISAGAVVAVSYFPAKAAVPVVIGMLLQQILASTYGHIVDHYYRKQAKATERWVSLLRYFLARLKK